MTYVIPAANWGVVLADIIAQAQDGDVIIVRSAAMLELAQRAARRMCPTRQLTFEVAATDAAFE